jgi:hypothetical protein
MGSKGRSLHNRHSGDVAICKQEVLHLCPRQVD